MSSIDKELLKSIRKIKLRMSRNIIIDQLIWGFTLGLCSGSLVSIASLLIPLYKVHLIIYKIIAAAVTIGLLLSIGRIPKDKKAAQKADELGLKERITTSLELMGEEDGFSTLVKKDAINKLQQLEYRKKLPYIVKRVHLITFAAAVVIIISCSFIQTPAKIKAEEKYRFEIMQEEKLNNIAIQEQSIKRSPSLKEEDKKDLLNNLAALKKEVKDAKNIKDIENSLTKFQIKTEEIKQKYSEKDLNNITSGLSRNESTSNLAKAVESGNKEAISQEIKNLSDSLKNSSPQEQAQIAKNFAQMAKNIEDSDLKKSLTDIADKLSSSSPDKLNNLGASLNNFNTSLQKPLDNRDTKNEIKGIQEDLMPEGNKSSNSQNQDLQNNSSSNNNSNNNQTQPDSNSNNSNSTNNSNSQSDNSNNSSPGQNTTSDTGTSSQNGKSGSQQPDNAEGLTKQGNNSGKQEENVYALPPPDSQGAAVPAKPQSLNSVIGKYKEKAYENMNSSIIPEGMKDIVKGYFGSLEN